MLAALLSVLSLSQHLSVVTASTSVLTFSYGCLDAVVILASSLPLIPLVSLVPGDVVLTIEMLISSLVEIHFCVAVD